MHPSPEEPASEGGCQAPVVSPDSITRHNLTVESLFSAFNGVFMGMILGAASVIALARLDASIIELTIMTCAFPCGAFLGPLWAALGRRWGMKKLVTQMAIWANLPLFAMFMVSDAAMFTVIITISLLLHSAMRMGMSSMYRATYPRDLFGRVLGWLTFWTFFTMVPTVMLAGWLTDHYPDSYRWLYPLAGLSGLIGCRFYTRLRVLAGETLSRQSRSFRSSVRGVRRVVVNDRAYMLFQLAFFLSGSAFFMSTHITWKLTHETLGFEAFELALWLSVIPQLVLAISSLVWGRVMDRIGIVGTRLLISAVMTVYLAGYFGGILWQLPVLICLGSILRGLSEGGGQLTWSLASSLFAPRSEDVPLYSGIHFVLNGIRGLVMPFVGTAIFLLAPGPWTLLLAIGVSAMSVLVIMRSLRYGGGPTPKITMPGRVPGKAVEPAAEAS